MKRNGALRAMNGAQEEWEQKSGNKRVDTKKWEQKSGHKKMGMEEWERNE